MRLSAFLSIPEPGVGLTCSYEGSLKNETPPKTYKSADIYLTSIP